MSKAGQPETTTETPILYGENAWVQYLKEKPLPARASSLKKLRALIQRDTTTLQQLTAHVKTDPVLSLYVVIEAQAALTGKKDSEIKSIDHAVSSLGFDALYKVSRKITPMALNPSSVQQKQFMRAVANSHHAAVQARSWMERRHLPFVDEGFLAALFYSVGFWALWLHAPLHMHKIQVRVRDQGDAPMLVEQDILGCTMQQISLGLSRSWGLSELTQQCQDHQTSPSKETLSQLHQRAIKDPRLTSQEVRELNHVTQERHFPLKLANWVALSVSRGWTSKQAARTVDLISDYLGTETEQTAALLHKTCAQASREYHAPGTLAPAAEMLMIPSDISSPYKLGPKELAALEPNFPEPVTAQMREELNSSHYQDEALFKKITDVLSKGQHSYTKPSQILQVMLKGQFQGLGMKRLALCLVSVQNRSIRSAQVAGFDKQHPIAFFETELSGATLFSRLCTKQACVHINDSNRSKYTPLLPDGFAELASKGDWVVMSIFSANKPIALLYADMNSDDEERAAIDNFLLERFRYLCSAATVALKKL